MDPSSQKSTYVLVNPVSKVIFFLAWQKSKTVQQVIEASDDDSTTESEFENNYDDDDDDDDDDAESDAEAHKLRSESVNSVLTKNTTIALYSSSNSLELFYLCKVIDFGFAIESMVDEYNHIIPQGWCGLKIKL